jgi:twitching motility protein PilU
MNVQPLFNLMVEKRASDLFLTCFAPVKIKIDGKIMPVNKLELTPQMVRQAAMELMTGDQLEEFNRELEIDFAISKPGLGRFRVNIFHQRSNVAIVMRYITHDLPDLDVLGMPPILKDLIMFRRGLVLMVGATGSGKSTTLAGMINYRNEKTASHIITIEDPIEYLHTNKKSIINQREVGVDTKSYARALKSAMREAPDVILIGEVRDRETMQAAIDLAGTGHLAVATIHSNNAPETLDRMINLFPEEQHAQVFMDLSQYLRAIISQRLVRGTEGPARCGCRGHAQYAAYCRTGAARRHQQGQGIVCRQHRAGHAVLRSGAAQALQGRQDFNGRGAGQRRFALEQSRGADSFCVKRSAVEYRAVHAHPLHLALAVDHHRCDATRAATDRTGHELLDTQLTGQLEAASQFFHGAQHRRRAAGIDGHGRQVGGTARMRASCGRDR